MKHALPLLNFAGCMARLTLRTGQGVMGALVAFSLLSQPAAAQNAVGTDFIMRVGNNSSTMVERARVTQDGSIGIGISSPAAALHVSGSIVSNSNSAGSSRTVDWFLADMQYTTADCGAFTFSNMQDGGNYTLAVQGSSLGTCSFSHSGLTFRLPPNHGATTGESHAIYSFIRMGTIVYVTAVLSPEASLIPRTAGVNIGSMTNQAGLAAAFDGVTNQVQNSSAQSAAAGNNGWIGKRLAAPTRVDRVVIYGASNGGYVAGANPNVTINLRGKVGTAPTGKTDGTIIGTTGAFTDGNVTNSRTITSTDKTTKWDHLFLDFVQTSGDRSVLAEMEIYGWQ